MMKFNNEPIPSFDHLTTDREEEHLIIDSFNEKEEYFKPIEKFQDNIEKILFIQEQIFFICKYKTEVKYQIFLQEIYKTKIVIKNKHFKTQIELKLNSVNCFVCEIKKDKIDIIICQDNGLYKLVDYKKLEFIYDMKINFLIPINKNQYIISNNNGIFKYKGSILEITRENLEIKENAITKKKYTSGVLINEETIILYKLDEFMVYNINEMKPILEFKRGFAENFYTLLLSVEENMFLTNEKKLHNLLLFVLKKNKNMGF